MPGDNTNQKCPHCGSRDTYTRSDGDYACNTCPGITPATEVTQ